MSVGGGNRHKRCPAGAALNQSSSYRLVLSDTAAVDENNSTSI